MLNITLIVHYSGCYANFLLIVVSLSYNSELFLDVLAIFVVLQRRETQLYMVLQLYNFRRNSEK